jgi:predicted aspartyl protease
MKKKIFMFTLQLRDKKAPQLDSLLLILKSQKIEVRKVLIDTGFEGDLALPIDLAINLEVNSFGLQAVEFGDSQGELKFSFAEVELNNTRFKVKVLWLENSIEPLIGSGFFSKYSNILQLNYAANSISILFK